MFFEVSTDGVNCEPYSTAAVGKTTEWKPQYCEINVWKNSENYSHGYWSLVWKNTSEMSVQCPMCDLSDECRSFSDFSCQEYTSLWYPRNWRTLWKDLSAYSLFQQAYSRQLVHFLPFHLSESLTDSCAGSECEAKKKKGHIAAHYHPTKQMGDHATHKQSLRFLRSGIFQTKSRYSCVWKPQNILVVTLKEWQ